MNVRIPPGVCPPLIVREPVGVNCSSTKSGVAGMLPAAKGGPDACRGAMARIDASRLEEGLGHELFECDACHRRVKYVPPGVAGNFSFVVVR